MGTMTGQISDSEFQQELLGGIRPDRLTFTPQNHQRASVAQDPVASSPVVLLWTTFDRWILGTPPYTHPLTLLLLIPQQLKKK